MPKRESGVLSGSGNLERKANFDPHALIYSSSATGVVRCCSGGCEDCDRLPYSPIHTDDPQETLTVSVALRQVSERSGRTTKRLTANYSAIADGEPLAGRNGASRPHPTLTRHSSHRRVSILRNALVAIRLVVHSAHLCRPITLLRFVGLKDDAVLQGVAESTH